MDLTFCAYNMEWMKDLFRSDGTPKRSDDPDPEDRKHGQRSEFLAAVVKAINPDILCISEGPDTLADGSKTASQQLERWRDLHNLDPDYEAVHGDPSGGQQELCGFFRKAKLSWSTIPSGTREKILSMSLFSLTR